MLTGLRFTCAVTLSNRSRIASRKPVFIESAITSVVTPATTPIIVLTADATERQHARLIAAGATAYLTKPIDVRQLLDLVDHNLTNSHTTLTTTEPKLARRS